MTAVAAGPATGAGTAERTPWKGLLVQPIAILVVLAGFVVWLATADLTATERSTLNPSGILDLTGQHLVLTLQATVLVLVIGIPLGVLLTRGPFRRASTAVIAVANFGQAAPAVGLIVLLAAWLGLNSWSRSSPWCSTRSCRCSGTRCSACRASTSGSSRPGGAWA